MADFKVDEFKSLSEEFQNSIIQLGIKHWAHFAKMSASEIVKIKGVTLIDLKNVFTRLELMGIGFKVETDRLDTYYLKEKNKTADEVYIDELLDTPINEFFKYQNRTISSLHRANIYTLKDLAVYDIVDIIKLDGIGGKTITVIQETLKAHNLLWLIQSKKKLYPVDL